MAKHSVSNNKKAGGGNKVSNNKPASKPKQNNQPSQSNQTGWGGNPGAVFNELHDFNTSTYNLGEENKPIEPFLTQEDIEKYAEAKEQYEEGLKELDRNYETKQHSNEYEDAEIEVGRKQGKTSADWDYAGRGLFSSSIRAMDLSDIDATAEIKKKFLSDQLSALAVYNAGQKKSMETQWNRYEQATARKKVENAEEVNSTMPKWKVEPHWEQNQTTSSPKPAAQQQPKFKRNEPIGFNPTHQKSKNGGITAPPPNNSISPNQKAKNSNHVAVANNKIAGKLYGHK